MHITAFNGRISIKYKDYKISQETLQKLVENALENGTLYAETIGKDKLQTLIHE